MISTYQADQVLLRFARISDQHARRFLERLRQLRRLGVPPGVPKGRGLASGRTFEQMVETALAIRLLEAGLASSAVAELVRRDWALARTVFMLFDQKLTKAEWPDGPPTDVYWAVAPAGLADYQDDCDVAQPRLTTLMLFQGEKLEDALATWPERGPSIILVEGREVVASLLAAYPAAGVEVPGADQLAY